MVEPSETLRSDATPTAGGEFADMIKNGVPVSPDADSKLQAAKRSDAIARGQGLRLGRQQNVFFVIVIIVLVVVAMGGRRGS